MAAKKEAQQPEVKTSEELKAERKKLKEDKKAQKKEVKRRARELAEQEAEMYGDEEPGGIPVFFVTLLIVLVWLAVLAMLVKLDVGGIGSNVLSPLIRNVPVINVILPEPKSAGGENGEEGSEEEDAYAGYTNLKDAVNQIRALEMELQAAQEKNLAYESENASLKEEVARLRGFEDERTEFEKQKEEFYKEVVYAENGPGADAYTKYYEGMDPSTAATLYQQAVMQKEASKDVQQYAEAYAAMKAKDAAAIFDTMTDDLALVSKILGAMGADDRGKILAEMKEEIAARVTKMMDPDNGNGN